MVTSVLKHGGSGFLTLLYQGQRLAYLRVIEDKPNSTPALPPFTASTTASVPLVADGRDGHLEAEFHEIWNDALWHQIVTNRKNRGRSLRDCLQAALEAGDLELHKIIMFPTGGPRTYVYDLRGVQIAELAPPPNGSHTTMGIAGGLIAKTIRFTPHPYISHLMVNHSLTTPSGRNPTPGSSVSVSWRPGVRHGEHDDVQLPDIQVARYALRSFDLRGGNLASVFKGSTWNGGGAVAECKQSDPCANPPSPDPHRCGLYGTLTLDQLHFEYGKYAPFCVAVFAAEGRTMLGTRGLRTAAARIVGFWVPTPHQRAIFALHAPEARHFRKIEDLLAEYKFPESKDACHFPPYDPNPPPEPVGSGFGSDFSRYTPPGIHRQGLHQYSAPAPPVSANPAKDLARLQALLPQATAGGLAAIQQVLGVTATATGTSLCWNCNAPHAGPPGRCPACAAHFGTHRGATPLPVRCGKCNQTLAGGCSCPANTPFTRP